MLYIYSAKQTNFLSKALPL